MSVVVTDHTLIRVGAVAKITGAHRKSMRWPREIHSHRMQGFHRSIWTSPMGRKRPSDQDCGATGLNGRFSARRGIREAPKSGVLRVQRKLGFGLFRNEVIP